MHLSKMLNSIAAITLTGTLAACVVSRPTEHSLSDGQTTSDAAALRRQAQALAPIIQKALSLSVNQPGAEKMMQGALEGALKTLDPHSAYLNPVDYQMLLDEHAGGYGGIGTKLSNDDGKVKMLVHDGGAAARAGAISGDIIIGVNHEEVAGKSLPEVSHLIRGKEGTSVTITVERDGKQFDLTAVREKIETPAVTKVSMIGNVGYIRLDTFANDNAENEVRAAVIKLQDESSGQIAGYILDLQDNGGGLIGQAVDIADDFIDGTGKIVDVRSRDPAHDASFFAKPGDITGGKPLVVLVDRGTASASEIFSAAIQDSDRGEIIGTITYGKGSAQAILPLNDIFHDGRKDAVQITTALHYRPTGSTIQGQGITPNLRIFQQAAAGDKERPAEAAMPGALANPNKVPAAVIRNDGVCSMADRLPANIKDANLLDKDGNPDIALACGIEFITKKPVFTKITP